MSRVLLAHGYDISFGFLHDGVESGRASLVWCAIEEHRATLARRLFDYMGGKTFKAADFSMRDSGEVRLGRIVSMEVAQEAIKAVPISKLVSTANWLGKTLKDTAACWRVAAIWSGLAPDNSAFGHCMKMQDRPFSFTYG
jgi:hypothetical protein